MAEANAFMSVNFLPTFIEAYRNHPCLWKSKSKDYFDKRLKDAAYNELVNVTNQVFFGCDVEFVKKKIDLIRGSFRREHRKVMASVGDDGVAMFTPKLWYYKLLLFLADQEEVHLQPTRSSTRVKAEDLEPVVTEEDDSSGQNYEALTEDQELFEQVLTTCKVQDRESEASSSKRFRLENNLVGANSTTNEEFELFGKSVAAQLKNMDRMQSIYAQNVINQVLFKGKLHKLDENSKL